MNIFKRLLSGTTKTIEKDFQKIISRKSRYLLSLAQIIVDNSLNLEKISRYNLIQIHTAALDVEDFLDAIDALSNRYWYSFRRAVAVIKIISQVCYKLLHIYESLPIYRLLEVEGNFNEDTDHHIKQMREFLISSCVVLLEEAKRRSVSFSLEGTVSVPLDNDMISEGKLPSTRHIRHENSLRSTVVMLATEFLNLSESDAILECNDIEKRCKISLLEFIPTPLNEESVRLLEVRFHNMQSRYDSFVSDSDLFQQDSNLPVMRGHISIIYHLLEILTEIIHFYQRHIDVTDHSKSLDKRNERSFIQLVSYCIAYADRYRKASKSLCQEMLKQYAEKGEISVDIPQYRGFHVRPSTLIAKIVMHYGSEVKMILYDTEYDAMVPLDLFRANEEINAQKRKYILEIVASLESYTVIKAEQKLNFTELKELAKQIFIELIEQKNIVTYDPTFNFNQIEESENEDNMAFIKRIISLYIAMGKIDVCLPEKVVFAGDKRILQDIQILAQNGYGEDAFGNNIVLPKALSYLRS